MPFNGMLVFGAPRHCMSCPIGCIANFPLTDQDDVLKASAHLQGVGPQTADSQVAL